MRKRESIRYLENAREILSKSPVEENRYADIKYVQEACGTAYLAILRAVDEYLLKKGISKKELPQSVDDYRVKGTRGDEGMRGGDARGRRF